MVGPSWLIKGGRIKGGKSAEYERKGPRGIPISIQNVATCDLLAQVSPVSAPVQGPPGQSPLIVAKVSPVAILGETHPRWLVGSITALKPSNVVSVNMSAARAGPGARARIAATPAAVAKR